MDSYAKVRQEFNRKTDAVKKETHASIYTQDSSDIVLYEKLLELQEQITILKDAIGQLKKPNC